MYLCLGLKEYALCICVFLCLWMLNQHFNMQDSTLSLFNVFKLQALKIWFECLYISIPTCFAFCVIFPFCSPSPYFQCMSRYQCFFKAAQSWTFYLFIFQSIQLTWISYMNKSVYLYLRFVLTDESKYLIFYWQVVDYNYIISELRSVMFFFCVFTWSGSMNFLFFFSGKYFISISFLKHRFTGYSILGWK